MEEENHVELSHQVEEDDAAATIKNVVDPYPYINDRSFTSEIYKIEIANLPTRFGYSQLRKLLNNKLHLNSHKIKGAGANATWAFVTFRCAEDRDKALQVLTGYTWKGKTLKAKVALPATDPVAKKRVQSQNESIAKKPKLKETSEDISTLVSLEDVVSPLSNKSYDEQLMIKDAAARQFLVKFGRLVQKKLNTIPQWLKENRSRHNLTASLTTVKPSPVVDGYRNKCEFTVGFGTDGERAVGFRLSRYTAGSTTVAEVKDCCIVPQLMKEVVHLFQNYVRASDKDPFDPETHKGYWRQLTVRLSSQSQQILVIVVMHPQDLDQEKLDAVKEGLRHLFCDETIQPRVSSVYFQALANRISGETALLEHVGGEKYISETLLGKEFRISPDAFFQVNKAAAEILYNEIGQLVTQDKASTIIDICCGTGTIGIMLSQLVPTVIGIEMVPHAVEDAKANAELNNVGNMQFFCGKAEDVLHSTLSNLAEGTTVAIADPPRAGLHNRVIRTLRSCKSIETIIYISCDPNAAIVNFIDLVRPTSNKYWGEGFVLCSVIPVDMFPHTHHCEMIMVFKRQLPSLNSSSTEMEMAEEVTGQ